MEQYINKSAVVAEIERLDEEKRVFYAPDVLHDLEAFIDTLETKEVDLDKEFELFLDEVEGVPRMWHSDEQIEWAKDIAKHFFVLGLKARKGE